MNTNKETTMHQHRAVESRTETKPFTGCVCSDRCDQRAHGNVCFVEHCACGATRSKNSNATVERSPWREADEDTDD